MDEFCEISNRIKKYFDDLEPLKKRGISNRLEYYAASMMLFSILNDCIRAAEVFMSLKHYSAPMSYREMLELLEAKGAISQKTGKQMKVLFSKRNLLAHEYGDITDADISGLMKNIDVVKSFLSDLANAK